MLNKIMINTDEHEIQIRRNEPVGWQVIVYEIEHSTKDLHEQMNLKSFDSAYVYVKENYLQQFFNKGVLV
mgnify:CR=1 FL=1